jgi:hypothetical protein
LAVEVEALVHTLIQHIFTQSFECASASPSLGGRQIRFLLKAPCILEALPMLAESRPGEEKKKTQQEEDSVGFRTPLGAGIGSNSQ